MKMTIDTEAMTITIYEDMIVDDLLRYMEAHNMDFSDYKIKANYNIVQSYIY